MSILELVLLLWVQAGVVDRRAEVRVEPLDSEGSVVVSYEPVRGQHRVHGE
jgi:hypothetical protein